MSGKLFVNWDDFRANSYNSIKKLRASSDFADVTLACEDGGEVEAHKFLLSAASPFFQNLLLRNPHPHPIIYMRGLDSPVLIAIVDFLYCGKVEMDPEYLEPFLAIAEELKLEGLLKEPADVVKSEKPKPSTQHQIRVDKELLNPAAKKLLSPATKLLTPAAKAELLSNYNQLQTRIKPSQAEILIENGVFPAEDGIISDSIQFSGDQDELDKTVKSMMQRNKCKDSVGLCKYVYVCNICGKEGQQTTIKGHIEAKHVGGITIPCNMCEKIFRTRPNLRAHKRNNHSGSE